MKIKYLLLLILFNQIAFTQNENNYKFEDITRLKATPVKNQDNTGTCWSYATTSFLESEILRLTNEEVNLSEMFFVNKAYNKKAINYIRYHGVSNFTQGGQAHDVINVAKENGILPEEIYTGYLSNSKIHNHNELELLLSEMLKVFVQNKNGSLNPDWNKCITSVIDIYLGKPSLSFNYKGKSTTSFSLRDDFGLKMDDYIEFTSYNHHDYYKKIILEIPDNWSNGEYYNVPIDDLMKIINYSIDAGFSLVFDGDVSEKEFSHKKGIAICPEKPWLDKTQEEKDKTCVEIEKEKQITQEERQDAFNNYSSTDDHLMHIIGKAKNIDDTIYFITKNSWGDSSNKVGGNVYISENYIRLNTVAILVNKNAVPNYILKSINLK